MRRTLQWATCVAVTLGMAGNADAQSIQSSLSQLLTEQRPSSAISPDADAVATTLASISGLVAVELATLPADSSSGGFAYRLNPTLGVVGRTSTGFGPFLTESVLRGGRDQSGLAVRFRTASFNSLQDGTLSDGTFPANATRLTGSTAPLSVDLLELNIETRSVTLTGTYGVTDRLSVGGALPIVRVSLRGQRSRAQGSASVLQSSLSSTSTGLGDIGMHGRYRLIGDGASGVSVGADLRLPTGSEEDLRGAGSAAARSLLIGSWEQGNLALHANGGLGVGGVSRDLFWSGAAAYALTPRFTVIGELFGRHLAELNRVADVFVASPANPSIESMRWVSVEQGLHTTFFVGGAKWNVARNWLLNGNVMVRADDNGLRARVTPTLSLEFDFQR